MASENPRQLRMAADRRLIEYNAVCGIDPRCNVCCGYFSSRLPQRGWVLRNRDRVQIDDAKDAVVVVLHSHPIADSAQIVAQVQVTRGLNSTEYAIGRRAQDQISNKGEC